MNFEDIPKRIRKREGSPDVGFRHQVRQITDSLGNSSFLNPAIATLTPLILSVITVIILLSYSLALEEPLMDGMFTLTVLSLLGLIIQVVVLTLTFTYIGYISYHQIKYNVYRWTGVITVGIMILSMFSVKNLIFLLGI